MEVCKSGGNDEHLVTPGNTTGILEVGSTMYYWSYLKCISPGKTHLTVTVKKTLELEWNDGQIVELYSVYCQVVGIPYIK